MTVTSSLDVLVAWIEANGPVVVTDAQLAAANPCALYQEYDAATGTWTYSVPAWRAYRRMRRIVRT